MDPVHLHCAEDQSVLAMQAICMTFVYFYVMFVLLTVANYAVLIASICDNYIYSLLKSYPVGEKRTKVHCVHLILLHQSSTSFVVLTPNPNSNLQPSFLWFMMYLLPKFHENQPHNFSIVMLTDSHTDRQTDEQTASDPSCLQTGATNRVLPRLI